MIIAVDAQALPGKKTKDNLPAFLHTVCLLALQKKEHSFFIISENDLPLLPAFSSNVEIISRNNPGKTGLFAKLLHRKKLIANLKKIQAGTLISFEADRSVPISQLLVLCEKMKLKEGSVKNAALIIVNSDWQKKVLEKKHKAVVGKIEVVPVAVNEFYNPANEEEKEKIKTEYCGGREYFLCTAKKFNDDLFTGLLKSFSHFKKRQQSNMRLVMLAKPGKKILKSLSTYKYRNDISIIENINTETETPLISASYAVIITAGEGQPVFNTLKAMQCGVPVIAFTNSAVKEIAGDAALYVEDESEKAIGEKMIRLYTDEGLRNQLIKKGKTIASGYTQQKSADHLWNCICKAVK